MRVIRTSVHGMRRAAQIKVSNQCSQRGWLLTMYRSCRPALTKKCLLQSVALLKQPLLHTSLDSCCGLQASCAVNVLMQIKDSVQRFAESPAAKGAAVKPEAVTEEGVLHLFGPDGMLVIQYDATLLPQEVAKDVMEKLQEFEQRGPAQRSAN